MQTVKCKQETELQSGLAMVVFTDLCVVKKRYQYHDKQPVFTVKEKLSQVQVWVTSYPVTALIITHSLISLDSLDPSLINHPKRETFLTCCYVIRPTRPPSPRCVPTSVRRPRRCATSGCSWPSSRRRSCPPRPGPPRTPPAASASPGRGRG